MSNDNAERTFKIPIVPSESPFLYPATFSRIPHQYSNACSKLGLAAEIASHYIFKAARKCPRSVQMALSGRTNA
jgi:hypothetical protein